MVFRGRYAFVCFGTEFDIFVAINFLFLLWIDTWHLPGWKFTLNFLGITVILYLQSYSLGRVSIVRKGAWDQYKPIKIV
jgi:hypothetical protein